MSSYHHNARRPVSNTPSPAKPAQNKRENPFTIEELWEIKEKGLEAEMMPRWKMCEIVLGKQPAFVEFEKHCREILSKNTLEKTFGLEGVQTLDAARKKVGPFPQPVRKFGLDN